MVSLGADLCLAFHRSIESGRGKRDCISRAIAAGIPTWLVDGEDAVPRRLRLTGGGH